MRLTEVSLAALGNSPWIPHDTYQTPVGITLAGFISSGAVLTWAVQGTCDDVSSGAARPVFISQAANTVTITDLGPPSRLGTHGLSVGDDVTIQGSGIGIDGEYGVATVVSATQYTVQSIVSQAKTSSVGKVISARVFPHAVLTNQNGRNQSQWGYPVKASRLVVTAYTGGVASLEVLQGALSS